MPDMHPLAATMRIRVKQVESIWWEARVDVASIGSREFDMNAPSPFRIATLPEGAVALALYETQNALTAVSSLPARDRPDSRDGGTWPAPRAWEPDTTESAVDLVMHTVTEGGDGSFSTRWRLEGLDGEALGGVYAGNAIEHDVGESLRVAFWHATLRVSKVAVAALTREAELEAQPAPR